MARSAIPGDWRSTVPARPRRPRRRKNGQLVRIQNTASARNGRGRSVVRINVKHGGESKVLRLGKLDLRSREGQQYRERVTGLVAHLGGADMVSVPQQSLVDQAARVRILVGLAWDELTASGVFVGGQPTPALHAFLRLIGEERSVLVTLGLERREKPVPSLDEYLRSKAAENRRDDVDDPEDGE